MKQLPLSECPRCKGTDRYYYADMMNNNDDSKAFPQGLWDLVSGTAGTGMYENITQCPDCGAYYSNTNECGFMENDIELNRISPTVAGVALSEEDLKTFKEWLQHPDALTREYGAECLLDYYVSKDMTEEIEKLCRHKDKAIRLNSIVCLLKQDKEKYVDMYKDIFENDSDDQVRMNASRYFLYNDKAIANMLPFFVEKLKADVIKRDAARILETYLYEGIEGLEDRRKAVKSEVEKQKIDLSDESFEYLRKKLA